MQFSRLIQLIGLATVANTASIPSLSRRDCSDSPSVTVSGNSDLYCASYCEKSTTNVVGAPIKVSDNIKCTTPTCSDSHQYSTTITSTFTVNVGLSSKEAEDTLSAGASWSYAVAVGVTDTYTFNLNRGM
jgi:hypothetical protein